jgi:predicted PurR-regulated permease PerM
MPSLGPAKITRTEEPSVVERPAPFPHLLPTLLVVGALWWAQAVVIPIAVSLVVSYALEPVVARLEAWRVPRVAAVPVVLLAFLSCLGTGMYAMRGPVVTFANRLPDAAHSIAQAVRSRSGNLTKLQQAATELESAAQPSGRRPRTADGVQSVRIEQTAFAWSDWIWQGSHGAAELGAQLFAVICLAYCLLVAGDLFRRKLMRIVGPSFSDRKLTIEILGEIDRQIGLFLITRAVISAVVGAAVWLAFSLIGLEQASVWAVIAAILFNVPLVGPLVVIVGAAIAAVLQTGSPGSAVWAATAVTLIAAVEGNILAPLLLGRAGEMNTAAIFVSLLFWGWLWGGWGLILAVPITAALKAVCERIDDLQPYAELLKP